MNVRKIVISTGIVFIVLYSCSTQKGVLTLKKHKIIPPIAKPLLIESEIELKEVVPMVLKAPRDTSMAEIKRYLEEIRQYYSSDNKKLNYNNYILRMFIDSLAHKNDLTNALNNRLLLSNLNNQQKIFSDAQKLLLEKRKQEKLKKTNEIINQNIETREDYTSIFLLTGLMANILMTGFLWIYKRKQLKLLSRNYNLPYA
jgi:hypothetical protein